MHIHAALFNTKQLKRLQKTKPKDDEQSFQDDLTASIADIFSTTIIDVLAAKAAHVRTRIKRRTMLLRIRNHDELRSCANPALHSVFGTTTVTTKPAIKLGMAISSTTIVILHLSLKPSFRQQHSWFSG